MFKVEILLAWFDVVGKCVGKVGKRTMKMDSCVGTFYQACARAAGSRLSVDDAKKRWCRLIVVACADCSVGGYSVHGSGNQERCNGLRPSRGGVIGAFKKAVNLEGTEML